MRDIVLEETIYMDFTTRAFASGVPTVLAGTPVLSVLEENNATPITAGVSVSVDRASVVGLNMATIVATAANGYEVGKGYSVYISTGTVGGVSVIGEVVAQFTIDASSATQDLANGTDGLTVLKASLDDIPTVAEFNARTLVAASYFDPAADTVANVTTVATTTTNTDMRGTDSANTVVPPSVAQFNARTILSADYFDPTADAVANVTLCTTTTTNTDMRGTDSALLAANINLTAGAVDNVTLVATTTTNTDMRGTDGANTTTPPTAAAVTDAVWDEAQSGHTTAGTFGKFLDVEVSSVSGGGGLTQQNVRDAMKLTPTGGAPSSGSVDEHLDDILTDTGTTIPGTISALNDVAATDIVSSGAITTSGGAVSTVTTVGTTTTNTDMRGTDSAATATNLATVDTNVDSILVDTSTILPALIDDLAIKKNTIFSNFEFLMVLTSDGRTPATGLTVTGQRSIDGGSFTSVGGTIAEVSNGIYQFDALAADTNGDVITWRFSSATADDTFITFKTVA